MSVDFQIIDLNEDNISDHGIGCTSNPKYLGYKPKVDWLRQRFPEGLRIKIIKEEGKSCGFIEYVPGEYAWRSIDATGYMFIHCIWVYPKKYQNNGYGTILLKECISDARIQGKNGVAVITSEGSWMAGKELFIKQGFEQVDRSGRFDLLVKKFKNAEDPRFRKNDGTPYKGLHLLYSDQCPTCLKFVNGIKEHCDKEGIHIKVSKLTDHRQAQSNPCVFGVFSLIYDGTVLADNPISTTRFRNIIKKYK